MKIILQDNNNYIIRFDKGEDVIAGLGAFMKAQSVNACAFSGLGAASEVEMAFYNPFTKESRRKPYVEEFEIVSFSGNGSLANGAPTIHSHGIFGRNDFTLLGAHVFKLVVSVTCEITLTKFVGEMKREMNADFNLNLLV